MRSAPKQSGNKKTLKSTRKKKSTQKTSSKKARRKKRPRSKTRAPSPLTILDELPAGRLSNAQLLVAELQPGQDEPATLPLPKVLLGLGMSVVPTVRTN